LHIISAHDDARSRPSVHAGNSAIAEDLWVTLSREEIEKVTCRRTVVDARSPEDQRLVDILPALEYTIGQENADIRIAAARGPAGVLQQDFLREASHNDEEVGVHDRRAFVRDPILIRLPPALAVRTDSFNGHLRRHVQELEALCAQSGEVWTVFLVTHEERLRSKSTCFGPLR
jgi:hypothetical protein